MLLRLWQVGSYLNFQVGGANWLQRHLLGSGAPRVVVTGVDLGFQVRDGGLLAKETHHLAEGPGP